MSEADRITSDKNVENVTKRDIDVLNELINAYEAGLPGCNELMNSEVSAIKNILAEREQKGNKMSEADKEIDIEELKEALKLWIKKWKQEREICKEKQCKEEEIKLTSLIYLAQWIINSKKGYAVDITKILRK